MSLNSLTAISPIDGRYNNQTKCLQKYFSESALIKYRIRVEIEYFIALCRIPLPELKNFPKRKFTALRKLHTEFSEESSKRVKAIEQEINHDVKAIEYFIKEEFRKLDISDFEEFIHFGLTSQDINNTSVPLSIKEAYCDIFMPKIYKIITELKQLSKEWKDIPMLARTHGQAASPTRLGKEIAVFVERLSKQIQLIEKIPFTGKFGGATGNFNAHHISYPKNNWKKFADNFMKDIGLNRQQYTTQIEHYDNLAALMDNIKRINIILIDFSRDVWSYISMNYFKQAVNKNEVGSSTMPHKVNPIDFENAEGNLCISNSILSFLSSKLPISRLQRDLTDSTVLRNIGVPFAHNLIAFHSLNKGIKKIIVNKEAIHQDLDNNWAVCAEAIQTILRKEGYPSPYEALKDLTRNNNVITKENLIDFINHLDISEKTKKELRNITPFNYTGV